MNSNNNKKNINNYNINKIKSYLYEYFCKKFKDSNAHYIIMVHLRMKLKIMETIDIFNIGIVVYHILDLQIEVVEYNLE